jgi:heme-degrading monooxygenase HmoA
VSTSADGPFLVVATHTRVAKGERRAFGDHVDAIKTQLDGQPGFIGQSLRANMPGRERWTMTVWEDEASMLAFVVSDAHLAAMGQSTTVIDGVYSAAWWVDAEELPVSWSDAVEKLNEAAPDEPW